MRRLVWRCISKWYDIDQDRFISRQFSVDHISVMLKSVSPQLSPSGAGSRVIRMSPDQEQTLEAQFSRVKNPHPTDLVLLAAETGLDERDVQNIFEYRMLREEDELRQMYFLVYLQLDINFLFVLLSRVAKDMLDEIYCGI
uniref:Homeobox domain-containing protein n=1 Tax=Timema bartmani TaxID=61472 RepID=A0A7R9F3X2_9NEOP|nr:unnamed protein product [Timema bartmani]